MFARSALHVHMRVVCGSVRIDSVMHIRVVTQSLRAFHRGRARDTFACRSAHARALPCHRRSAARPVRMRMRGLRRFRSKIGITTAIAITPAAAIGMCRAAVRHTDCPLHGCGRMIDQPFAWSCSIATGSGAPGRPPARRGLCGLRRRRASARHNASDLIVNDECGLHTVGRAGGQLPTAIDVGAAISAALPAGAAGAGACDVAVRAGGPHICVIRQSIRSDGTTAIAIADAIAVAVGGSPAVGVRRR
jgi:hypothetical protein